MLFYLISLFFTFVFWNYSVTLDAGSKLITFPVPILALIYIFACALSFKIYVFFKQFSSSSIALQQKKAKAQEKCLESIIAFIGGNEQHGRELWQEASVFLEKEDLFLLLSVCNAKFLPEYSKKASELLSVSGSQIHGFFKDYSSYKESKSINLLVELYNNFNLPWVYEELINRYLDQGMFKNAEKVLRKFWQSGSLSVPLWKSLRAKIFYIKAKSESDFNLRMKLMKRANAFDCSLGVFELVDYYKNTNLNKARKIIESAWKVCPSIKLGKLYVELDDSDLLPIHKFQHAKELENHNSNSFLSSILVATYAMESSLWAIAKESLLKLEKTHSSVANILMARLEIKKNNDSKAWERVEKAFIEISNKGDLDLHLLI